MFGTKSRTHSENCSTPPTTPLDELALKRHRFFADLIDAAHAAIEHRVRFDQLEPVVTAEPEASQEPIKNSKSSLMLMHVVENTKIP